MGLSTGLDGWTEELEGPNIVSKMGAWARHWLHGWMEDLNAIKISIIRIHHLPFLDFHRGREEWRL
jgi:hypothetical protein